MVNENLLASMDFVVYSSDTTESLIEKEYGISEDFSVKMEAKVGIVVEVCGYKFILCFGEKIEIKPASMLLNSIIDIKRNIIYNDTRNLYMTQKILIQAMALDIEGKESILTAAKKLNSGNLSAMIVYLTTAQQIPYPEEYANGKIKLSEILEFKYGFTTIT